MFWKLLKKELQVELRSKEITASMLTFGLTIILTFAFAFNISTSLYNTFAPGLLWVMVLFISVLGLHRMFAFEKDFDAFSLTISAPIDRGLIFLSKWISGTILILLSELFIIPPFFLFLQLSADFSWGMGIQILVLGNSAIMVIGSLVSGLAMRAKMSEVLLPILLFPLVSPVIIAASKASGGLLSGLPKEQYQFWILILLTFNVIYGIVGYTIFEHITEE